MPLRVGEFFAGIGGFRVAAEAVNAARPGTFEVVFANDVDPKCKATYDANFASPGLTVADLRALDPAELPAMDVVVGGFPCQPFSTQGKRGALGDERRGQLFFALAAVVRAKRPAWVLLENVKNLVHIDKGAALAAVVQELRGMGYAVAYKVLDTVKHTGVPQHRERVYIFASLDAARAEAFPWPAPVAAPRPLAELLEPGRVPDRYYYAPAHKAHALLEATLQEPFKFYLMWTCTDLKARSVGVSPTLTANMGLGGNGVPVFRDATGGIRKLTVRECFRLQGFPDSYALPEGLSHTTLYCQIGNAVSPPLVERLLLAAATTEKEPQV